MKILIELGLQEEANLVEKARQLNLRPEDLAQVLLRNLLSHSSDDFSRAADRVLQKNQELYKRLS